MFHSQLDLITAGDISAMSGYQLVQRGQCGGSEHGLGLPIQHDVDK